MLLHTNFIGLDEHKAQNLAESLNELLANYQVFYQNVRGYHWNIKGEKFFELHTKFEELYGNLQLKIDEIAERILTLGATPLHSFKAYTQLAKVKTVENVHDAKEAVRGILEAFHLLLFLQRALLKESEEAQDEGSNALMSDYIREQEKLVWMYAAYLA
ncbi:MAG: Dps family protein [Bacteroidota bacterium]